MVRSRQRKARDPASKPEPKVKVSGSSKEDCEDPKDNSQKDRRHEFGADPVEKPKPRSKSKGRSKTEKEEIFGRGSIEIHEPQPPTRLIGPTQSPRDPNLYRAIRLSNGIRIALISNCGFNPEDLAYIEAKKPVKPTGRIPDGKKCRRASSDLDTPSSKRSRPAQKDENCLDVRIAEFNKDVLHFCETPEECPTPMTAGPANFFSFCCGPTFLPMNENLMVEGKSDEPLPDPVTDTVKLEDEVLITPQPPPDPDLPPDTPVPLVEVPPPEIRINKWHKVDPAEDEDSLETAECNQELLKGFYNVSSIAVTVPWGPLYEPDDAPGIGTLVRHCLQGCDHTSPNTGEETSTFMIYMRPNDIVRDIGCLSKKFHPPQIDRECVTARLERLNMPGSYIDRLRTKNWNLYGKALLTDPKRIKLMTLLAKPDHPVRKAGTGGKVDKRLTELSRSTVDRAITEFLRNNCKPQYMTVGIEAPKPLAELEELAVKHFNKAGLLIPDIARPELRKLTGEPDPFDTEEFRKLYKVHPSPTGTCPAGECAKSSLFLSFPLPPDTWRNYKTKPLVYLSYMIGHQGVGGLYAYLHSRQWITNLEAKSMESSYHHNQFVTMFELHFQLTEDGFEEIENVLTATFSYLKMLGNRGPQKRIFKELQRLQAIDFHSMGKTIDKLTVLRGAQHLSKALHFAVSRDIVLFPNIMTDFNGPLLSDLMSLFKPNLANILLVSDNYTPEELDKEEPFLLTKYSVQDVPTNWKDAWSKVSVFPEFRLPTPNIYIPENFCMVDGDVTPESNRPKSIEEERDDFHDVWHMRDPRYQTRAGCILHFVTPLGMLNVQNSTKMSLFNKIFKKTLKPVLYPAELGGLFYKVNRTHFGILVKVEANRDKIGLIVGAMAKTLHSFQDNLTEETFAVEKALYKQHICCKIRHPNKLAMNIQNTLTLRNAWLVTDSLPILDDMTLESFKQFVEAMKKDLYFLLLVVGNASVADARQLAQSILDALPVQTKVTSKKIERIKVMQWPACEQCVRVKSFDKFNKRTLMVLHFQVGLTESLNIVCTKLIEPLLQSYFISKSELPRKRIYVMVRVTQAHNVLMLSLMTWFPVDSGTDPETVDEDIELALESFFCDVLEKMKPNDLKGLKKHLLCSCQPMCTWYSSNHDINYLAEGVKLLDVESLGTPVQTKACECLTVEDLKKWYTGVFLDPESEQRCSSSAPGQKRKLSVVVIGNVPVVEVKKEVAVSAAPPTATSLPASKILKRAEKDKGKTCNKSTCQALLEKSQKKVELSFAIPQAKTDSKNLTKDEDHLYFITNFRKFKGGLYKYPSYNPGN